MNRRERRAATKLGQAPNSPAPATAVSPAVADVLAAGVAYHQSWRLAEAESCYRRVLAAQPNHADALNMLGVLAHQVGRADMAAALIRQAIEINGGNAAYLSNLGCVLQNKGKVSDAIEAYRQAILIDPRLPQAHCNLGDMLRHQGEIEKAIAACREAIRLKPDLAEAHCNLGTALQDQGKLDEAAAAYRQALQISPDYAEAHCNLGIVQSDQGKLSEAVTSCLQAIRIKPHFAEAHCALGIALGHQGKLVEAVRVCHQAISIAPDHATAHCALGNALYDQGRLDDAIAAYRQVIRLKPDHAGASSSLLMCLNYDDRVTARTLFEAHRGWDERYAVFKKVAHDNDRSAERRLRVGYVSPDFRDHSVANFLEPLLKGHDRGAMEVFCYAEVSAPDAATERFKCLADHWLTTVGMSDAALAERIRRDGIDILVDLAGHTGKNRLLVFARKPSPVQVTWLGYPNTTGLSVIDYRLVDAVTDPEGADAFASETLVRLPGGFLCYAAPQDKPQPAEPPCFAAGVVTFGSFNNAAKLSEITLDAWATLLGRLPKARLLLKSRAFADEGTRAAHLDRMRAHGMSPERVDLVAWLPASDHLASYGRVDVALDPFPYNGTTTTCEALWMGVPVVTLRGDRHAGRVGASLLSQIGLTDLIAGSVDEYVEIAARLANDPPRLADLRRSLRPYIAASPLCDGAAFARKVEAAYRTVWQRWCAAAVAAGSRQRGERT